MSPSSAGMTSNTDDLRGAALVIGQSAEVLRGFDTTALAVPGEQSGSPRMGSALQALQQRWTRIVSDAVGECDWIAAQLSATADAIQSSDLDAAQGLASAGQLDLEWSSRHSTGTDSGAPQQPEPASPSAGDRWV